MRVAFGTLVILSTLSACRKEDGPARWDVDIAAPLFETRFILADILPDSVQAVDAQGGITLVYTEELFAVDLDTVFELPDTVYRYPYAFPLPGNDSFNLPAGFPVISQNNLIRFNIPDVSLIRLDARSGSLVVRMRNKIASRVTGAFTLPGAGFADGNNTISSSVEAGTPADPRTSTTVKDLAGARFDLRGPALNDVNTLSTSVSAQLDPNGSGATVTNQDSVVIETFYEDLVPAYVKGSFGQRSLNYASTNPLALFQNFVSGGLDLDRVRLQVRVENGIGMDLRLRLNALQAVNTRTNVTVDMAHAILQGPINLNRALDLGNGFQTTHYVNELDNDDSNVDAFLENLPDQLRYDLDMELNPLGDISNGNDFAYHDSRLRAELELEVPLDVIANDLVLENIVRPDLPGNEDDPLMGATTVHLFAENGFPFDAQVVLDIVDIERELLSSVPVPGRIDPGTLGTDGLVATRTASELIAELTEEQVQLLYGPGRFRIRIIFNTPEGAGHVRLLDRYALDMRFTVEARYYVNGQ